MAQFDRYANTDADTNQSFPFFVDVQTMLLNSLNSRVVIPLVGIDYANNTYSATHSATYPANLCPVLTINGNRFLGQYECSIADYRDEIISAMDFLLTGV